MTIKVRVKKITENEIVAIMESHGWNGYGIETMLEDLAEWFPNGLTKSQLLEVLADYEDDTSLVKADYENYYFDMLEMMYN